MWGVPHPPQRFEFNVSIKGPGVRDQGPQERGSLNP
jgi:hypothetical protein